MTMPQQIEFVHFPTLDEIDQSIAERTINKSYEKVSRIARKDDLKVKIQVRTYHRSQGRKEYEVHSRFDDPQIKVLSTAKDWNFLSALEDSLKILESETIRRFKR